MNVSLNWFENFGNSKDLDKRTLINVIDDNFIEHAKLHATEEQEIHIDNCVKSFKAQLATINAKAQISLLPLDKLVESFELTDQMEYSEELPIIREWLMDELESRNPVAFEEWLFSNQTSLKPYFL